MNSAIIEPVDTAEEGTIASMTTFPPLLRTLTDAMEDELYHVPSQFYSNNSTTAPNSEEMLTIPEFSHDFDMDMDSMHSMEDATLTNPTIMDSDDNNIFNEFADPDIFNSILPIKEKQQDEFAFDNFNNSPILIPVDEIEEFSDEEFDEDDYFEPIDSCSSEDVEVEGEEEGEAQEEQEEHQYKHLHPHQHPHQDQDQDQDQVPVKEAEEPVQTPQPQVDSHTCNLINPATNSPCLKQFSRPYDLIRHQSTIHAPQKKIFRCMVCNELEGGVSSKSFSRGDALSRHIKLKHGLTGEEASRAIQYAKEHVEYV